MYYTLIGKCSKSEPWEIIFGDYDREAVEAELDELRGFSEYRVLKIISTSHEQAAIQQRVDSLNKGEQA